MFLNNISFLIGYVSCRHLSSFNDEVLIDACRRLFVCLFVCSTHSRIFHSFGDATITGEGLQILTHARHLRPLSSEGSLACSTCCDTGHPFIMVISEDPWHSYILPSVKQLSCHHLFYSPNRSSSELFWSQFVCCPSSSLSSLSSLYLLKTFHIFIFFSRTTGPISTKIGTKHPWGLGIQVCSDEGATPFSKGI